MTHLFTSPQIQKLPQPLKAIVEEKITPDQPGRIKFDGTSWAAKFYHSHCDKTVQPGEKVWVTARQGLTLLICL